MDLRAWKTKREALRAADAVLRPKAQKPIAPLGALSEGGVAAIDAQIHRIEATRDVLWKRQQQSERQTAELEIQAHRAEAMAMAIKQRHADADAKVQAWKERHPLRMVFGHTAELDELRTMRKTEAQKARQAGKDANTVSHALTLAREDQAQIRAAMAAADNTLRNLFDKRERVRAAEWAAQREAAHNDPEFRALQRESEERARAVMRGETLNPEWSISGPKSEQHRPVPTLKRGRSR